MTFEKHDMLAGESVETLVKTFFFRSLDFGRKNSRNFGEDFFLEIN